MPAFRPGSETPEAISRARQGAGIASVPVREERRRSVAGASSARPPPLENAHSTRSRAAHTIRSGSPRYGSPGKPPTPYGPSEMMQVGAGQSAYRFSARSKWIDTWPRVYRRPGPGSGWFRPGPGNSRTCNALPVILNVAPRFKPPPALRPPASPSTKQPPVERNLVR